MMDVNRHSEIFPDIPENHVAAMDLTAFRRVAVVGGVATGKSVLCGCAVRLWTEFKDKKVSLVSMHGDETAYIPEGNPAVSFQKTPDLVQPGQVPDGYDVSIIPTAAPTLGLLERDEEVQWLAWQRLHGAAFATELRKWADVLFWLPTHNSLPMFLSDMSEDAATVDAVVDIKSDWADIESNHRRPIVVFEFNELGRLSSIDRTRAFDFVN